ncbi:HXXEE domain-containing protein [Kribbella sp. NBC_00482]|uniref:HXXEE domain-containing protein n=1 Tax=Kribbella sp. NBC_00482 TaxID=2975968 RepID=UPI002E17486E
MKKVAWGLLAAWIIHDLEELATMPSFSQRTDLPTPLTKVLPMSRTEAATAIGLTGIAMAAASAAGAATNGRSKFFQASLMGFGLHAGTHLAQSALLRRYTPGLITTPLVVIPFTTWAWRRLKTEAVPIAPPDRRLTLALAAVVPLAHTIARLPRLRPKSP